MQRTVPFCDFGNDFHTVEELLERHTPCLVRGLETAKHAEVARQWSPKTLLEQEHARTSVMTLRATEGPQHTRTMCYSQRDKNDPSADFSMLGGEGQKWPRGRYDAWYFKKDVTMFDMLQPAAGFSASFSGSPAMFREAHPLGAAACDALAAALPHRSQVQETLIWIASRGLGQQLHFDSSHNLFFHLHGEKHVVLSPPPTVLRGAHLHPATHPSQRQSQLLWSGDDSGRAPPTFNVHIARDCHGDARAEKPKAFNKSQT